jgi:hypothetical protein
VRRRVYLYRDRVNFSEAHIVHNGPVPTLSLRAISGISVSLPQNENAEVRAVTLSEGTLVRALMICYERSERGVSLLLTQWVAEKVSGSSGRTRTYNPSVNSRTLDPLQINYLAIFPCAYSQIRIRYVTRRSANLLSLAAKVSAKVRSMSSGDTMIARKAVAARWGKKGK